MGIYELQTKFRFGGYRGLYNMGFRAGPNKGYTSNLVQGSSST